MRRLSCSFFSFFILLSVVFVFAGESTSISAVDTSVANKNGLEVSVKKADVKVKNTPIVLSMVKKKSQAVLAGNALFLAGAAIQYGLVLPQSRKLKATDLEGQLALLSPSILAFGLRIAGTPISCMRTSEVFDIYNRESEGARDNNYAWNGYFTGWGLLAAGNALNVIGVLTGEKWATSASFAVSITSDVVWAATNIYSYYYIKGIVKDASGLSVAPGLINGNPGLACIVRF